MSSSLVLEQLPLVERLSSRVVRVLGLNPGPYTLQGTNTYVVGTGERRVLIDAGDPDRDDYLAILRDTVKGLGARISHILVTHWHKDHVGGVAGVCRMTNPVPHVMKLPCTRDPSQEPLAHSNLKHEFLTDGAKVQVQGATLRVVATPGHTEDHMTLLLEEENSAFVGDCILGQGSSVFEDLRDYMESLQRLKSLSPSTLYPGHGPMVRRAAEKIQEYIEHRNSREAEVCAVLQKHVDTCTEGKGTGLTSVNIVNAIYKDISPALLLGAERNVILVLQKLLEEGKIKKITESNDVVHWSKL